MEVGDLIERRGAPRRNSLRAVEGYTPLNFAFTNEQIALRDHVVEFISDTVWPELAIECAHDQQGAIVGPEGREFLRRLGSAGWLGLNWPQEYGGQGRAAIDQWVFQEELDYRKLPFGDLTSNSVAPTIMEAGTEEQKELYLSGILRGDYLFAIGLTEPNAGTDVASLNTRARLSGDEYVVNGQKVFTTLANIATHIWLAVRTGASSPKHQGLTVLVVPTATTGITIRPLWTQSGTRTNEVFLDDVRVPVSARIGPEGGGWSIMMKQLNHERLLPHSSLRRQLECLLTTAIETTNGDGEPLIESSWWRRKLGQLQAELDVARLLSLYAAWTIDQGRTPVVEASMNKIWQSELRERLANAGLDLLGERGMLCASDPDAADGESFERHYRLYPALKFTGGANEIQRDIIAQRGLGLPRFGGTR